MGEVSTGRERDHRALDARGHDSKPSRIGVGDAPAGVVDGERADIVGRVGERDGAGRVGDSQRCAGDGASLREVSARGECDHRPLDTCSSNAKGTRAGIGDNTAGVGDRDRKGIVGGARQRYNTSRVGDRERCGGENGCCLGEITRGRERDDAPGDSGDKPHDPHIKSIRVGVGDGAAGVVDGDRGHIIGGIRQRHCADSVFHRQRGACDRARLRDGAGEDEIDLLSLNAGCGDIKASIGCIGDVAAGVGYRHRRGVVGGIGQ